MISVPMYICAFLLMYQLFNVMLMDVLIDYLCFFSPVNNISKMCVTLNHLNLNKSLHI